MQDSATRKLYIPILTTKYNGNRQFALCRRRSETYENAKSLHDYNDRAIASIWGTDEVKWIYPRVTDY
jgi:hypothetical protein